MDIVKKTKREETIPLAKKQVNSHEKQWPGQVAGTFHVSKVNPVVDLPPVSLRPGFHLITTLTHPLLLLEINEMCWEK